MPSSWRQNGKSACSTRCAAPSKSPGKGTSRHAPPRPSEAWLRFLAAAELGGRAWTTALRSAGDAESLLGMSDHGRAALGLDHAARTRLAKASSVPPSWPEWLEAPDRALVTLGSDAYPPYLAELVDAPLALWVRGRHTAMLGEPQIALVGSRHPTAGGRVTAEGFGRALSDCGLTVTSGLAVGIDAAGHTGALGGPGGTIAVLGCGIDTVYPRRHGALAERIAAAGLVVSEHPPGSPTRAFHFPRRNRIIAGLTLGTLVVEAARRSGSLITARLAADYGREVFALPGSIHSALSKGCHALLRQGAKLVEDVADVLVELAPSLEIASGAGLPAVPTRVDESRQGLRKLAELLGFAPVTLGELAACSGLTTAELSSMLLHLEMEGSVEALPGGRYCRLAKRSR